MFGQTRRLLGVLAGTTGLTLALGVGASTGLVPKLANSEAAQSDQVAAQEVTEGGSSFNTLEPESPPTTLAPPPPTTTPPTTSAPKVTVPPTTKAPAPRVAATVPAAVAAPVAPAAAAVAAVVQTVARTVPSHAQVISAIGGLQALVPALGLFPPTVAQVNDIGNQVCTAFDQGQSFAQVKATALSMIPKSIAVPPTAPDYAVRQAVALYCPGHASKLV